MDARRKMWVVLAAVMLAVLVPVVSAEFADHVVISEVQIKQNEFVELYNPTDSDIVMTGWYWCYFSPSKNWNEPYRCKEFLNGATIPAYGYYLIGLSGYSSPMSDWQPYDTPLFNNNKGAVAIFPWDPREKTDEKAEAGCIDAVGWKKDNPMDEPHVYEGVPTSNPAEGKSIVRKTDATGVDPLYGNAWDTDNNNIDFIIQYADPQNSGYGSLPPLPEPGTLAFLLVGLLLLVCIGGFKRLKNE